MVNLTEFQRKVLETIRQFPGESAGWLATVCKSSPQAIGRAAMRLSNNNLAYSGIAIGGDLCYWPWK